MMSISVFLIDNTPIKKISEFVIENVPETIYMFDLGVNLANRVNGLTRRRDCSNGGLGYEGMGIEDES
jgi:hypothetical protein